MWRRGEHLHATMTSGPVQLATHSISVEGGNQEAIKRQSRGNQRSSATHSISVRGRQSRGNQEAIKRQSEVISDPLDLGASRRREQRVQVRQLLTQQHLWGSVARRGERLHARQSMQDRCAHAAAPRTFSSKALKRPSEVLSEIAPRGSRASAYRRRAAWRPMRPPPPPSSRLAELTKLRSRLAELTKLRSRLAELTKLRSRLAELTKLRRRTRQWRARRRHVPTPPRAAGRRAR